MRRHRGVSEPLALRYKCQDLPSCDTICFLTEIRAGYVHLRVVIQRLEEMLIRHLDVAHPVEQILRSRVVHSKLNKLTSHRHVRRSFHDVETVRSGILSLSALLLGNPRKLEPISVVETADRLHESLNKQICLPL